MIERVDFVVIGAGIAGASLAYELSKTASVVLVEREHQPGYHSTGRSAAVFTEIYGNAAIRALTVASGSFFANPPAGFSEHPLSTPRPLIMVACSDQRAELQALYDEAVLLVPTLRMLDAAEVLQRAPMLRADYVDGGLLEETSSDLDVHAIHSGFLRGARSRKTRVVQNAEVVGLARSRGGDWTVETSAGSIGAGAVVNAAGAWADEIAGLAGARPIGLLPKRRSAFIFSFDPPQPVEAWPTVIDISEKFYFKPDAGRLLGSPADETPSAPCDAQPEEIDIAIAIDRISQAADFTVRSVDRKWAGLRSFVSDKTPVVGYDDEVEGFFWLAAQGGYGIQTSPALARAAAALITGASMPENIASLGVGSATLSPVRLRSGRA
ncbi:FAD-binding oxidoreductase [Aliihoeflea sp. 40Bstr573]|uniref:NAD(P)/FAD-dependent oxidoreductase n=1 Tax=Aliihoeflea sp. 40Bstr573 TaxID=2696467 RepID=UPI002094E267|nr:FAD-dependent oxidoreductase [Aliihoeflea sp. 40Bstr573]MCO6388753.1 FAD-dependent oxidoreductase [Aliihoeflea sp. 40Bstr573]